VTALLRPTTIDDVLERLDRFRSEEAEAAAQVFEARPDDVVICTYTKSGTTWMQQVVHQVRSGGSMDFTEISAVVPWLESAVDMGIDPSADQQWSPRAFKSHLMWRDAPRGARYITVFRDPMTVLPSFYRFFEGWWFEPGTVSVQDFARELYMGGSASGRHWDHLIDWWPRVGAGDVLALAYEDMIQEPDRVPPVVAEFLDISVDVPTMERVIRNCSRSYMAQRSTQFDEQLIRERRDVIWGLPPGGDTAKVTSDGSRVDIPAGVAAELDDMWASTVGAVLGFADYEELRRALPNPLGARR